MVGRLPKLSATFALGLCLAAWLAPAGSGQNRPGARSSSAAPLGGVNIDGIADNIPLAVADQEIAQARALHADVVRTELPWSALEPTGPSKLNRRTLAYADRLTSDAAAGHIKVIMLTDSTPCWASSAPVSLLRKCVPGAQSRANSWPPRKPADYATFVAYLAQRYGTRLAAIEVWNEPDQANEDYFAGPDKAQRYAAILRAAYPAIKRVSGRVTVLAGSLVGFNGAFLRALYAAGIRGYYDGLAVHFYTLTLAALRSFRAVQVASGDSAPLWLDEFGWSSCWPKQRVQEEQPCVTSQIQGRNLADIFSSLAHTPWMDAVVSYQLQDVGSTSFGVLSARGTRKPSFTALSRVLASPFRTPSSPTLSLRRSGERMVASGSGPVGDYMQLEAFQGSVLRYTALFTLNRFDRYSIALPAVLGTSGLRVRVYQEWAGPGKYAQKTI